MDDPNLRRQPKNPSPGQRPPELSGTRQSSNVGTLFSGALIGMIVLAAILAVVFLGWRAVRGMHASDSGSATADSAPASSGSAGKPGNLLANSSAWQTGGGTARVLDESEKPDIGWWTRTFTLPKNDAVLAYLKNEGLSVSGVTPVHYVDTKDSTTITYQVHAQVPAELLSLQTIKWHAPTADQGRFANVLVINKGLQPGTMWDAQNPTVEAKAGTPMNFDFKVKLDKASSTVMTDQLPLSKGVFTQPQVQAFQVESTNTMNQLQAHIDGIDAQVKSDTEAKLAQVPADPPKPQLVSEHWNHGDGSGEPTKSAERIGGGTAAGAAGGAAFGAAAGDAGLGAGIGAGVGLLGGFIYDTVSKNSDREKYERRARAENEERIGEWKSQCRQLGKERDQIKLDGTGERKQLMDDLATQIASNSGRLDGLAAPSSPEPSVQPATDQPTGPIAAQADSGTVAGSNAMDTALKGKLVGYWKSPRHAYHYTKDGFMQMVNGDPKSQWSITGNVYHELDDGREYTYDILTLTDTKFVYRSRDANQETFTMTRISRSEAENF